RFAPILLDAEAVAVDRAERDLGFRMVALARPAKPIESGGFLLLRELAFAVCPAELVLGLGVALFRLGEEFAQRGLGRGAVDRWKQREGENERGQGKSLTDHFPCTPPRGLTASSFGGAENAALLET